MQLPVSFIKSIENVKGFDKEAFEKVHQSGEQITSIRFNPNKVTSNLQPPTLNLQQKVPWSSNGYYLSDRPSFTSDPIFHAGAYYVQEASSMFLEEVMRQTIDLTKPLRVLDLCAAPGGKSTLIQSIISSDSLLVSNEVIKTRVNILTENITKWGASNVIVTNNDPKDFQSLQNYFDVIVVDAPCSGSGLFRKDTDAIHEWSEQNVQLCSQRQERILADVLPSLKDDGVLIYSTCSYSEKEDEEILDKILEMHEAQSLPIQLNAVWGIVETISPIHKATGYRFYPDKVKGEGFFIAAIRFKKINSDNIKKHNSKSSIEKISKAEIDVIAKTIKNSAHYFYIKQNDEAIAVPKYFENDLSFIQTSLYIKKAGVRLGSIIRGELIPHHELAMCMGMETFFPKWDVDEHTALQYLRKNDIKLDADVKGWVRIAYSNFVLGWVKILPNRLNNYYPKEWRILNK